MTPEVSIIVPAYDEGPGITSTLESILKAVSRPCEVLVVFDSASDSTAPFVREYSSRDPRVRPVLNTSGRGPARAIKFAIASARANIVVVTMADGSDDATQIDQLTTLIEEGCVLAAASRYVRGGEQLGGPIVKKSLSKLAGLSLHWFGGVSIHDPTNSYKAYAKQFLDRVGIESDEGFEIGLELTAKAKRLGMRMGEIPTVWRDRSEGESNFHLTRWLPRYLRWYLFAFGSDRNAADDTSLAGDGR